MLVAGDLVKKCSITLKDPEFVRWSEAELLAYLDEAQKEIARNPGANTKSVLLSLIEGTKQALPDDTYILVSIVRNWVDDEPRNPVRITTRALLDAFEPEWHVTPRQQLVENYVYDDRTPRTFFVYPPNDGTGQVELLYSGIPPRITSVEDVLELRDEFETPLMMFMLYRAYTVDSDYSAGLGLASQFYSSYTASLNTALNAVGASTPNASLGKGAAKGNGGTE